MSLGQRIRQKRESLKITQNELAKALNMTPQYISLIEKDKTDPSLAVAKKLAEQLGTSIDYLVSGTEGVSPDVVHAIKADSILSLDAKKALIALVNILRIEQNSRQPLS